MTLQDLIERGLKEMKADGLVNSGCDCACVLGDLGPCGSINVGDCAPGKLVECDNQDPHHHHGDDDTDPDTCFNMDGKFYRMREIK